MMKVPVRYQSEVWGLRGNRRECAPIEGSVQQPKGMYGKEVCGNSRDCEAILGSVQQSKGACGNPKKCACACRRLCG